ncbi:General stress protein 69 [Thalassocella blandensis]|nr:General stress protein 69 [Thalassocella blandensis]
MKFRPLGNTDQQVSVIGLGTMTWGEQNSEQEAFAQMDMAIDYDINMFDVAEMYPVPPRQETQGRTEQYIGNWLSARKCRDKIFLATKVAGPVARNSGMAHLRGGPRLNREHIQQAVEASLKRLQTDHIDLYQVHWPERATNFFGRLDYEHSEEDVVSIEETLQALNELVQAGKVRYIGISNETPWGMMEYLRLAREQNLERIVSIQNPYNLLNRSFDVGAAEISIREKVSLLPYSPLAFGVLSGKYLQGSKPDGARLTLFDRFTRYTNPQAMQATQAYVELAQQHSLDPSQMALAFVNDRQTVASNLIGATNLEQLKTNIESVNLQLSEEVLDGIEAIHKQFSNPAP